jgi:anti-sigma factor RsiW
MSQPTSPDPQHRRVAELLPWYVSGTLHPAERGEVEHHLEHCGVCRGDVESERAVAAALRSSAEPAPAPHPGQLARLLERLDAAPDETRDGVRRAGSAGDAGSARSTLRDGGLWRWLAAGQAAAILALVGLLLGRAAPAPPPEYRTLADAGAPAAREGLDVALAPLRVRVLFEPAASAAELHELLLETGAQIVDGPSPLGAYTLELAPTADGDSPTLLLAVLRDDPAVRFAEPLATAP